MVRPNLVKVAAQRVYAEMGSPVQVLMPHILEYMKRKNITVQFVEGEEKKVWAKKKAGGYVAYVPALSGRTYWLCKALGFIVLGHADNFLAIKYRRDPSEAEEEMEMFAKELLLFNSGALAKEFFDENEELFREMTGAAGIPFNWAKEELGREIERLKKFKRVKKA
ncbi:hypothetical protein [Carboxydothermus ferrireducens]|uniref:Uncharacterized protein n=1 Tax=Carboxydothermus ferrireducens DSM 11255 TaxID=1119529 RepID=A0ABX2R7R1_9THEO|nr:hypothetical protein [Carboxydothermus ferrireducens]NYE57213.1 hypothetical protein [Carboxydothermus ferrireducens DSM 11255]